MFLSVVIAYDVIANRPTTGATTGALFFASDTKTLDRWNGTSWDRITISGTAKYTTSWTSQTSVTVTHNLATTAVIVQVFDAGGVLVQPESVTIVDSNNLTLAFGASFSGSVTVMGTGGGSKYATTWTSQTSVTITHNLGTTAIYAQVYDASGLLVQPESITVTGINTVILTFGAAFSGGVVVFA